MFCHLKLIFNIHLFRTSRGDLTNAITFDLFNILQFLMSTIFLRYNNNIFKKS